MDTDPATPSGLERFAAVDRYLGQLFGPPDPLFDDVLARAEAAGLPPIQVSEVHGRLLQVLVLARGARTILEIGTLAGYSALWMARTLPPGGRLVTLEREPAHAEVARRCIADAGLADTVEVLVGPALETLAGLADRDAGPFDMVFIDADKPPYAEYLEAAVRLSTSGTLIVADNVVRDGRVADGPSDDPAVAGVQRFNAVLAGHPALTAAVVQQVGEKGHDGMALAVVR